MFTRTELEVLTIPELRALSQRYGIKPTGSLAYKTSYLTSLIAFPAIALKQLEDGRGLRMPSFANLQNLGLALDEMNSLTDEQVALIRISFEGRRMEYPARYDQEKLLAIYRAKLLLEEAIALLSPL
ncbi:hypothetical protein NIES2100_31510 [Calothrix sp. NIES-2100]|uniref:hypothetical protein n=1 Tax=Calothrix sp. NIES-2100 TaxID=1954172 RepID=UPI000B5FAD07|nr:hypothetical protein NIES2100_31510 [Calothrix sp. NIES-2100]